MGHIRWFVLLLVLPTAACDVPSALQKSCDDERLSDIERKIKIGEEQLATIRKTLDDEQQKLEAAREEASFQQCQAKRTEVRAEVQRRRSECARELAEHHLCIANRSKDQATTGMGGCLLGIAAAAVSGGAAAPWALGGCGAGLAVGGALADTCPMPACASSFDTIERGVLADRGLSSLPRCGGWLGVAVVSSEEETSGIRVKRVEPGSYAATVGLVQGDVVVELRGRSVTSLEDLGTILGPVKLGTPLKIAIIRGNQRIELTGRAADRDAHGKHADRAVLGVVLETAAVRVQFQRGALIASLAPGSPAEQVLTRGEVIVEAVVPANQEQPARRRPISHPADLDLALGEVHAGEQISLSTVNNGQRRSVALRLGKREGQTGL